MILSSEPSINWMVPKVPKVPNIRLSKWGPIVNGHAPSNVQYRLPSSLEIPTYTRPRTRTCTNTHTQKQTCGSGAMQWVFGFYYFIFFGPRQPTSPCHPIRVTWPVCMGIKKFGFLPLSFRLIKIEPTKSKSWTFFLCFAQVVHKLT
jgi:hypothetical protein